MNSLRLEGQKTVAVELCQQLGWKVPDWVVIPGGNLGNAGALGKGFELMLELGLIDRLPRIAVAQAERRTRCTARSSGPGLADPDVRSRPIQARTTLATAIQIGDPVSVRRAMRVLQAFDGVVEEASESELADAAARADRAGAFTCPHTGVALAALEKLAARGVVKPRAAGGGRSPPRTASSSPTSRSGYHEGTLPGAAPRAAQSPGEARGHARRRCRKPSPPASGSAERWSRATPGWSRPPPRKPPSGPSTTSWPAGWRPAIPSTTSARGPTRPSAW